MSESTGPYFIDQDGDTIIIGPGVHADAPDGLELVDALDKHITRAFRAESIFARQDNIRDDIRDCVVALLNLAHAAGKQ